MAAIETDWWRRWPGIYQAEKADFERVGADVTEKRASNGQLTLDVRWPLQNGETVDLVVDYSPHHPHCRPRVSSDQFRTAFARHVDPFSGGLCLITQDGDQWNSHQTVAGLIDEQLQKIIDANAVRSEGTPAKAADLEEHAPDPLTAYYDHTCEVMSAVFFDGNAKTVTENFGLLDISIRNRQIQTPERPFEACLDHVNSAAGTRLSTMRGKWRPAGQWKAISGPWVRLDIPRSASADELFSAAQDKSRQLAILQPAMLQQLDQMWSQPFNITGILFQDEMKYDGERFGDAWLFVVSRQNTRGQTERTLARAHRLSDDILARAPSVQPFAGKKIVVLGTGAIGSFVAIELVRSGVAALVLVDHDSVEPGNSVRWPLGQASWGIPKSWALDAHIQLNYPRTKVTAEPRKIGSSFIDSKKGQVNHLKHDADMVRNADLVIDTTASVEVASALSNLCLDVGTDYLMAYATMGAAGGVVLEQPITGRACYVCLLENWASEILPGPPVDESGMIVPVGCNAPTFTGASFDLQEVSLSAVRSASAMLREQGLEHRQTRLAILDFTKSSERRIPEWSLKHVEAQCTRCNQKAD